MNLTITCSACQRTLRVPESLLGQAVKCPSCAHVFTAPDHAEDEAPRLPTPPSERLSSRPAPPPQEDYDDEPRPSRRPRRDEDYDDAPRRRGREKPGKVLAIAIMILIGGILATIYAVGLLCYIGLIGAASMGVGLVCCFWPGPYYALVLGIMGIIKGSRLLGEKAHQEVAPRGLGIMMIINIVNFDVWNMVLGIIVLVFLADEEVKDYFQHG